MTLRLLSLGILFSSSLVLQPMAAEAVGLTDGGIQGAYFANGTLAGAPAFTRNDVRLNFAWNGAAPGGSTGLGYSAVPATGFSARWTGTLVAPQSGSYTFTATTSGPARVRIGLQGSTAPSQIIDHTGAALNSATGTYTMSGGKPYTIVMEFQDQSSPAKAELDWQSAAMSQRPLEAGVPLGVNITSLADWDGSRMFADAMRQSRGWCTPSSCAAPVPSNGSGWPTQDFLTIPIAGPTELNGTYHLRFNGEAQVELMFGYGSFTVGGSSYAGILPRGVGYNAATNVTDAAMVVVPSDSINMFLNFTETQLRPSSPIGSGVAYIHLWRPSSPGSTAPVSPQTLFDPALEARIAPFTTLRFMDYFQTNGNALTTWSSRTLPAQAIQAGPNGGALEYAIMLANETGKDLWLNLPVSADDDYVTRVAQMLLYGSDGVNPYTVPQANPAYPPLQPNLAAYLEYSNEVWNFSFVQASTNYNLAVAEVNAGGSPLNYDGSTNTYYWGWRRVGERIKEISDDFRAVWGNAAMATRIRPVLEWQGGNGQDTADQQLSFLADYYDNADGIRHVTTPHPVSYYLWGGGGAWYHSVNDQTASTIDAIYASGLVDPTGVPIDSSWSKAFGLRETAYEGGFEIGGDTPSSLQLAANLDPRAQAMTTSGFDYYFNQGGDLALIYTIAGASAYGLADPTINDGATPKLAAVHASTTGNLPARVLGTAVNGSAVLPTTVADVAHNMWGPWGSTVYVCSGCWINWTIRANTPGPYMVSTNLGSVPGQQILLDGHGIGNSGAETTLGAGLHSLRVRYDGSSSLALTGISLTTP